MICFRLSSNKNQFFLDGLEIEFSFFLTDFFEKDQTFIILEFEFGGADLENSNGTVSKVMNEFSVGVLSLKLSLVNILVQILACKCTSMWWLF